MTTDAASEPKTASPLRGKRILVAKPGLDGHDAGAKVIALAMRDAGAEVIYTGLRKTPGYIARVAVDEDVDAVGLSILSGSHRELVADTVAALKEENAGDIALFVGGTIPSEDIGDLLAMGVKAVFTADMKLQDVIDAVARQLA
jgi:methylmalonyl-CoA mutase C-terminal domain/subunit